MDKDYQEVELKASGYEWECPTCETLNTEIEVSPEVTCVKCDEVFTTSEPEHSFC